jgi:ATP-dependent phosphofructokinase / diphosphate-dependent phosphofructokinase
MAAGKKIGILTGGGDVPGLNPVIKSVVYRGSEMGREVVGVRRGWEGLTNLNPKLDHDPAYILPLTRDNTRTIDRSGGTMLHTSRTNPRRIEKSKLPAHFSADEVKQLPFDGKYHDLTSVVMRNLERLGIGVLIAIGGDDTLSFASALHAKGVPLVAIPKTMDNDVQGTEYCIGFSTAITRAKELITRQRTTLGSHERIGIFRIFGRDAGFTALYTAYVTSSRCLIPEFEFDLDHVCELLFEDKQKNPSKYSLAIISEGAVWKDRKIEEYGDTDAYGHRHKVDIGHALAEEVRKKTGSETMASDLTYDLRSGDPDAIDELVAITFANIALDLIYDNITGRMVGIQNGCYAHVALPDLAKGARRVNVATAYNTHRYRPNYSAKLGAPLLFNRV